MKKILAAAIAASLLAMPVLAQQLRSEAESALRNAGVMVEIPEDATDDQLAQIIAITDSGDMNASQMEAEVKSILGMEE